MWELDTRTGAAARNLRHDQIFGYAEALPEWTYEMFLEHVLPEDRAEVARKQEGAVASGTPWKFETRVRRVDGEVIWISASGLPILNEAGETVRLIGHVIDITHIKRREERLRALADELNHRVNNTLGLVRSILNLSAPLARDAQDLRDAIDRRIAALARMNHLLTDTNLEGSTIAGVLEGEIAALGIDRSRVTLKGAVDQTLEMRSAESLALALQELLVNASTHGALGQPGGTLEIEATPQEGHGFLLHWRESSPQPPAEPEAEGYGTVLINRILRERVAMRRRFSPNGVNVVLALGDPPSLPPAEDAGEDEGADEAVASPADASAQSPEDPPQPSASAPRVMVVEDEMLIAMDLAQGLELQGYEVIGPFSTNAEALECLATPPDVALLDVNLGRETSAPVARRLRELQVPFAVLSGYGMTESFGPEYEAAPVLAKPYSESDMLELLKTLVPR